MRVFPNILLMLIFLSGSSVFGQDSTKCISSFDTIQQRVIYSQVDNMPQFPGGNDSLEYYILTKLKLEYGGCYQDRVYVTFIIEDDGRVTSVKILRIHVELLREQILNILNNMDNWKPGSCYGIRVPIRIIIPIKIN